MMVARLILFVAALAVAAAPVAAQSIDWGDAPDPPYPTLGMGVGASHRIRPDPGGVYLGAGVDPEPDGQPHPSALGDDNDGIDDEDGVIFTSLLVPGMMATVDVDVNITGWLSAWIDFDDDGSWNEPGDQIFAVLGLPPGVHSLTYLVPPTAEPGAVTFARFRFSADDVALPPTGYDDAGGEVEDHEVSIEETGYKWFQGPDIGTTGIDVNATSPYILADDFLCIEPGYITEIGIWGSWLSDYLPWGTDPMDVAFVLSIHGDIPDSLSPTGYSMPDAVLWQRLYHPYEFFTGEIWQSDILEGWLDPPDGYMFPADWTCWKYTFFVDTLAFYQEGTEEEPVVYWLDVQALPSDIGAYFGWKTAETHWNDDAVWGQGGEPYPGPWFDLRYPLGHPNELESIDLAFYMITEPPEYDLDWGDARDPTYPTLGASNGASHFITPGFQMGPRIDGDPDGQPEAHALGDDNDGNDDEDGVDFATQLEHGDTTDVGINMGWSAGGFLDAWVDFTDDGDWDDPDEQIFAAEPLTGGIYNSLRFVVPADAGLGVTYARFRLSSMGGLPYDGAAPDGEVEDYEVTIIPDYDEVKYIAYPVVDTVGTDVCATVTHTVPEIFYVLADDFPCFEPGSLTEIWVWGSWLGDSLPFGFQPDGAEFTLAIHEDIPDSLNPDGYSIPGAPLWDRTFAPGSYTADVWADYTPEGWLYPPLDWTFPADWTCWLYRFYIHPDLAFRQLGTPDDPKVYWLSVQAACDDPDAVFGWKDSFDNFNDSAVWGDGLCPHGGPWFELRYPPGHPWSFIDQFDLAFAIWSDFGASVPDDGTPVERVGLRQNRPNPFNPATTIEYSVPSGGGHVTIEIFDVAGRHVSTLVDRREDEGSRAITWSGLSADGKSLPSGVYFYRLAVAGLEEWRKMVLLK